MTVALLPLLVGPVARRVGQDLPAILHAAIQAVRVARDPDSEEGRRITPEEWRAIRDTVKASVLGRLDLLLTDVLDGNYRSIGDTLTQRRMGELYAHPETITPDEVQVLIRECRRHRG